MSHIPPHFWLEMLPAGAEAKEARSLRVEDRELLSAIGPRPSRVLDVFRRLRWAESQAFQDALGRMVIRGWVVAKEHLEASEVEQPGLGGNDVDPLVALLARYSQEAGAAGWADDDEALEEASPRLVEGQPPESRGIDDGFSEESHEVGGAAALGEEGGASSTVDEGPQPWELIPPSPPATAQDTAELLAAMGLGPAGAPRPAPRPSAPSPSPPMVSPSHEGLLKALLRGNPVPDLPPVVDVPAYGLGSPSTASPDASEDPGFVRLRDVGATVGPGDGPPSSPSTPVPRVRPVSPDAGRDNGPMSERTRRRMRDRQRMLDAARREREQRDQARERAERIRLEKEVAAEERERTLKHQRAIEEADRGSTFLSRAEKARRIRDADVPKPKDD